MSHEVLGKKRAFSILISHGSACQDIEKLEEISANLETFRALHPGWELSMLQGPDIEALLQDFFPPEVLEAYLTLQPYAYRADLARYCLLYLYGGIYFDATIRFLEPLPTEDGKLTVFRDTLNGTPFNCSNGLISAPVGHALFEKLIDRCVENCHAAYYGVNALAPTGPMLFGQVLAQICSPEELLCGDALMVPGSRPPALCFTHPLSSFGLVGYRRKKGPGLWDVGHSTGNDYSSIWRSRSVYGFAKPCAFHPDQADETTALPTPGVYLAEGTYRFGVEYDGPRYPEISVQLVSAASDMSQILVIDKLDGSGPVSLIADFEISQPAHDFQVALSVPVAWGAGCNTEHLAIRQITISLIRR